MDLGSTGKRELLLELQCASQSLRRLSRLIAKLPDGRGPRYRARPQNPGNGLLRTLGIGDLRAKPDGAAPPAPGGDPVDQARADIAAIFADRLHPYFHRHDPEHHQAVERVRALFATAYGND